MPNNTEDQIRDLINEIVNKNPEQKRLVKIYRNGYSRERCLDTLARLLADERINEKNKKINTSPCICLFPNKTGDKITMLIASNYDRTWHDKEYVSYLQEFINTAESDESEKKKKMSDHIVRKTKKTKVWARSSSQANKSSANEPPSSYEKFINAITLDDNIEKIEELASNAWDNFDQNQKKENLEPLLLVLDNKFIIESISSNKIDSEIVDILKASELKNPTDDNELSLKCEPGKKMYHPDMKIVAGIKKLKEQQGDLVGNYYLALSQLCCEACYRILDILNLKGEEFGSRGVMCGKFYKNWTIPDNILTSEELKSLQKGLEDLKTNYDASNKRDKINSLSISTSDLPPTFPTLLTTDEYDSNRVSEEILSLYNTWETKMLQNQESTTSTQILWTVTSSPKLDNIQPTNSFAFYLLISIGFSIFFIIKYFALKHSKKEKK